MGGSRDDEKGRPGHVIHVLAPPDAYRQVAGRLFEESTTLGLRYQVHRRLMLHRVVDVETPAGPVRQNWAGRRQSLEHRSRIRRLP